MVRSVITVLLFVVLIYVLSLYRELRKTEHAQIEEDKARYNCMMHSKERVSRDSCFKKIEINFERCFDKYYWIPKWRRHSGILNRKGFNNCLDH